ncbi:MAG: hypothetical protein WCS43_12680, partial [Verrucomicrobiota bacterium]
YQGLQTIFSPFPSLIAVRQRKQPLLANPADDRPNNRQRRITDGTHPEAPPRNTSSDEIC